MDLRGRRDKNKRKLFAEEPSLAHETTAAECRSQTEVAYLHKKVDSKVPDVRLVTYNRELDIFANTEPTAILSLSFAPRMNTRAKTAKTFAEDLSPISTLK